MMYTVFSLEGVFCGSLKPNSGKDTGRHIEIQRTIEFICYSSGLSVHKAQNRLS